MKSFKLIVLLAVLVYVVGDEPKQELVPTCKKMMMQFAKRQLKAFSDCLKDLKNVSADKQEVADKIHCAVKCVLAKENLLDETHKVTKATVQSFMDLNIPKMYHELGHEFMEHCLEDFGPKMDHDDQYCTAYGDFVQCVQDVIGEVC